MNLFSINPKEKNFCLFSYLNQKEIETLLLSEKELTTFIMKFLPQNCDDGKTQSRDKSNNTNVINFFKNQLLNQNVFDFLTKIKNVSKMGRNLIHPGSFLDIISSFVILSTIYISQDQSTFQKFKSNIDNILFSLALIYNELSENLKCLIVIKYFVILDVDEMNLNFNNFNHNHVKHYFTLYKNDSGQFFQKILQDLKLKNLLPDQFYENLFQMINLKYLITNEFKTNFLILMLNSLISFSNTDNYSDIVISTYNFLKSHRDIIISASSGNSNQTLSLRHFNNITKVLCKINENLLKSNLTEKNLTYSNLTKFLLYELLFSTNQVNIETNIALITNHINEMILLQSEMKKIQNLENLLEITKTHEFFDFISERFENFLHINEDIKFSYANVLGKIYNFYNNLTKKENSVTTTKTLTELNLNPIHTHKYSNKILNFYKIHKIVVNEAFFIKVNLFRDYLNDNKKNFNSNKIESILQTIEDNMEELSIICEILTLLSENDCENFLIVLKFLKKILENLLVILFNNLQLSISNSINNEVIVKIEAFFLTLFKKKKKILQKKNELIEFEQFFNFIKLFNLKIYDTSINETDKDYFSLYLFNFLNGDSYLVDDLKSKINLLINFILNKVETSNRNYQMKKISVLLSFLSKRNFELFLFGLNHFLKSLNETKQTSEIEIMLEWLHHMISECDYKYSSAAFPQFELIKENFLINLEIYFTSTFNKIIEDSLTTDFLLRDECDKKFLSTNKFFNYFKSLCLINNKLKNIFKSDCNFHILIFIDYLEKFISFTEEKKSVIKSSMENFLIDNFVCNDLLYKITNSQSDADYLMSIIYDYLLLKKDDIIQRIGSGDLMDRFVSKIKNYQNDERINFLTVKKALMNDLFFNDLCVNNTNNCKSNNFQSKNSEHFINKKNSVKQKSKAVNKNNNRTGDDYIHNNKRSCNEPSNKKKKIHFYESIDILFRNHFNDNEKNIRIGAKCNLSEKILSSLSGKFTTINLVLDNKTLNGLEDMDSIMKTNFRLNFLIEKEIINYSLAYFQIRSEDYKMKSEDSKEKSNLRELKSFYDEILKLFQFKYSNEENNFKDLLTKSLEDISSFFAESSKSTDLNDILFDFFYITDFYSVNKNSVTSTFLKILNNEKEKLIHKMDSTKLNLTEWIILIWILFIQSNSFDFNYEKSSFEEFKEYYNLIISFFEYSMDFLKLLSSLSSNYFYNYFKKKIFSVKKFLNSKQNNFSNKFQITHLNLFLELNYGLLSSKIQFMIKYTCEKFFKLSYKFNKSQEFYKIVTKLSQIKILSLDSNLISTISKYTFKFIKNWYKKVQINPKSYEFNSVNSFILFLSKLIRMALIKKNIDFTSEMLHQESESIFVILNDLLEICNKIYSQKDPSDPDKFIYEVIKFLSDFSIWLCKNEESHPSQKFQTHYSFLIYMENLNNLIILMIDKRNIIHSNELRIKKIYFEYLLNRQVIEENFSFISIDIENEYTRIFYSNNKNFNVIQFFIDNIMNLNLKLSKIISISMRIHKTEFIQFIQIVSVKKIVDEYKKILFNLMNNHTSFTFYKYFKIIKKIVDQIILTIIENKNKFKEVDIQTLIIFYIKYLINYNLYSPAIKNLSGKSITTINKQNLKKNSCSKYNFLSFFRIKNRFFFIIYFCEIFAYSVVDDSIMNRLIKKIRNIYVHFEDKEDLEISQWWEQRVNLERNMEELLFQLQRELLNSEKIRDCLKKIFNSNKKFLDYIISYFNKKDSNNNSEQYLDDEILDNLISNNINSIGKVKNTNKFFIKDFYRNENLKSTKISKKSNNSSMLDLYDDNKENIIHLIIDSELANFPIENLPIFYKLPIVRTLNYSFIKNNFDKNFEIDLTRENIYYILNPSKDLINTEERLKPLLREKLKFMGICGEEPNKKQLWNNLKQSRLYLYSGHSNGSQYLDNKLLKTTQINSISVLMGCSSVKIETFVSKNNHPVDLISYYQMNYCPAILGCLWDVTDKDIDKVTAVVLENLFLEKNTTSLLHALLKAKHFCYFKYLNSCSLVLYANYDIKISTDF